MSSLLTLLPLPLVFSKLSKELHPKFVLWYIKQFALEQYIERKKLECKNRTSLHTNFINFSVQNDVKFQFNIPSNKKHFDFYIRNLFGLKDKTQFTYRFIGKTLKWYSYFTVSKLYVNNQEIKSYANAKIEINIADSPKETFKRLFEMSDDPIEIIINNTDISTVNIWNELVQKFENITSLSFELKIQTKKSVEMLDFEKYNFEIFLLSTDTIDTNEKQIFDYTLQKENELFEPLLYLSDKYLKIIYKRMRSIEIKNELGQTIINYTNSKFKESNNEIEKFIGGALNCFWIDLVGYEMTLFSLDHSKRLIICFDKK